MVCFAGLSSLRNLLTTSTAIMTALETCSAVKSPFPSFKVTLPPPNVVLRLLPEGRPTVAIPEHCQMELVSPAQAVNIALALLDPIWKTLDSPSSISFIGALRTAMPVWVADCLDRLWTFCGRLKLFRISQRDQVDLLFLSFLSLLRLLIPDAVDVQAGITLSPRISTAFYETLSEITEQIYHLPSSASVQLELSHVLLCLAWFNRPSKQDGLVTFERSSTTTNLHNELLLPNLESIAQDESFIAELHPDLRVSIPLLLYCYPLNTDLHNRPPLSSVSGSRTTERMGGAILRLQFSRSRFVRRRDSKTLSCWRSSRSCYSKISRNFRTMRGLANDNELKIRIKKPATSPFGAT